MGGKNVKNKIKILLTLTSRFPSPANDESAASEVSKGRDEATGAASPTHTLVNFPVGVDYYLTGVWK